MKKKLLLVFSLFLCIFLASCRGNDKTATLTDNADSAVYEQLNLSVLENAVSANKNLDKTGKNYIDVKLPTDLNGSLVVRNIDITEAFGEEKIKVINVMALTFVTGISAEYQQAIMSEVFNSEYGITKEKLGLSVDILTGTSFSIKVSSGENVDVEKTNVSVIYLPVKVVIVNDSKKAADITILVPVYAEFNSGEASSVFAPFKVVTIDLEEDGSLPNKHE
jgi:hypothetical protein